MTVRGYQLHKPNSPAFSWYEVHGCFDYRSSTFHDCIAWALPKAWEFNCCYWCRCRRWHVDLVFCQSSLVREEKRTKDRVRSIESHNSALLNVSKLGRGHRQVPIRSHCHKRGHLELKWWVKYGKPDEKGLVSDLQHLHPMKMSDFNDKSSDK